MTLLEAPNDLRPGARPVCVALGVFDGVHLGHQRVIAQTLADARACGGLAVVVTFDRHPNAVVAPERVPPMIYSLPQKLRALAALKVDATWLIQFDETFRQQTGEAFVRRLAGDFEHLHSVSVGADFVFGRQRGGNVALLRTLGPTLGFGVHALEAVGLDGAPISSTRIREAIRAGEFAAASRMLGRPCTLAGPVVRGDELGRRLGFPTANLDAAGLALPPHGVYAAWAQRRDHERPAVVNVGVRPTLHQAKPALRVEAHLLDFDGDLYAQELELRWVARLRDEQKFGSLEALKDQIGKDIAAARQCLAKSDPTDLQASR